VNICKAIKRLKPSKSVGLDDIPPCHFAHIKRDNHVAVSSYRPISILNNVSNLSGFVTHDHVLHYVKRNPNQHGFTRTTCKYTVINLVTFLDIPISVVRSQRQADAF
jgi:hypothetical protein